MKHLHIHFGIRHATSVNSFNWWILVTVNQLMSLWLILFTNYSSELVRYAKSFLSGIHRAWNPGEKKKKKNWPKLWLRRASVNNIHESLKFDILVICSTILSFSSKEIEQIPCIKIQVKTTINLEKWLRKAKFIIKNFIKLRILILQEAKHLMYKGRKEKINLSRIVLWEI